MPDFDASDEGATTVLPRTSAADADPEAPPRGRRARRRNEDDDFGDFTYLRDPTDPDPGPSGRSGGGRR